MSHSRFKKKFSLFLLSFLVIWTFSITVGVGAVFAADVQCSNGYCPLAPIAGYTDTSNATDLSGYLKNMFKLGVAVATGLAVIMIVIGGIQYMSTDAISGKTEGREKIAAALWGLLIALASYAILQTINPDLLKTDFKVSPASGTTNSNANQNGGSLTSGGGAGAGPTIGSSGLSFTDPTLYTGLNGSPISSYYQDGNGNMVFNYQDGSQVIQYWDNNGPTGQGQYYNSGGEQMVGKHTILYTTYGSDGTPTYYYDDGTQCTGSKC